MNVVSTICSRYLNSGHSCTYKRVLLFVRVQFRSHSRQEKHVDQVPLQTVEFLVPKVRQWLGCTQDKAKEICAHLPNQKPVKDESVEECISYLMQNGIYLPTLLDNPWLLFLPLSIVKLRMNLLMKIGIKEDTVPLLKLTNHKLTSVVEQWLFDQATGAKFVNRLHYIAEKLQCSTIQVAIQMERHYPLLTLNFDRIERVMNLLLDNGIGPDDIKRDLWIFRHNEEMIFERMKTARLAGVDPIKTWMLRCPEIIFEHTLEKCHNDRHVLGSHKDHVSYLAERLQCSNEDVVLLTNRYERVLCINLPKVKLVLDFLYETGFTPEDVRNAPRVLGHSITTLKKRLQELNKLGYHPKCIRTLFTTAKEYKRLIEKIRKDRRNVDQVCDAK